MKSDLANSGKQIDATASRRRFLKNASIATLSTILGAEIVFGSKLPKGLLPIAITGDGDSAIPGKHSELILLNDRPLNMETPAHLLDPDITPTDVFFIRNNGRPPANVDASSWVLEIAGESAIKKASFSLQELKSKFKHYSYQLTLECAGNGRNEFDPPAKGNQWKLGAVGCPTWTGVRLKDVLNHVGIKDDAVYIGYYGKDTHLSGDTNKSPISRGVPISKALENESLIAWAINGEDLPAIHGYPLRLVFGGWPASTCGKWLSKIVVRNRIHDGAKMGDYSYRIPKRPIAPGEKVAYDDMKIIESMPIKSLVTYPKTGAMIKEGTVLNIRGKAWAGDNRVSQVQVSIDFGSTWKTCSLMNPANRLAWQSWSSPIQFPEKGYYEIWAKATDDEGRSQPMVVPGWNPKGYLNNACHRIAIKVT